MAKSNQYLPSDDKKSLEQRKRNKHKSPRGKKSGAGVWLKTRRRIRRKMLDR